MPTPRDITDADPGRGSRLPRLAVIALGLAVIGAVLFVSLPHATFVAGKATPTPSSRPRSVGLLGAAFPDHRRGWLLTGDGVSGGRLWRSSDGGRTWSIGMDVPPGSTIGGLHLGSDGVGYVVTLSTPQGVGSNGLWLTSDGGQAFEEHSFPNPSGHLLTGLSMPVGGAYALFSDGKFPPTALLYRREGENWTFRSTVGNGGRPFSAGPSRFPLFGLGTPIAFLDALHGIIATQTSQGELEVDATADGGLSWTAHPLSIGAPGLPAAVTTAVVEGVLLLLVSYSMGADSPRSYLFRSLDGGSTWSAPSVLPTEDGFTTPTVAGSALIWVPMGRGIEVSTDGGAHWRSGTLDLPGTTRVEAVYPIDDRRAWAFAGAAPGPPQLLYETNDGGKTWTVQKPPG